jgi:hypothetical protein
MEESTFYRKATMEDFLDDGETIDQSQTQNQNNKHNKNHSNNDNNVQKNQQEFGHKKRIKP